MPILPPLLRPGRRRTAPLVGALAALAVAGAGLGAAAVPVSASPVSATPVSASPAVPASLAAQAAAARSRLAADLAVAHPGVAVALTHPGADGLDAGSAGATGAAVPMAVGSRAAGPSTTAPTGVLGVDVSSYQGDVTWSKPAAAGMQFAYVKATEGTTYTNPYFASQYDGSYEAGLIRGAYTFAVPNDATGTADADYFVANGGGWSADGRTLPGMLDLEFNPYGPSCYGLTSAQLVAWVAAFDAEYTVLTGRPPAIYTNTTWWDDCIGTSTVAAADPLVLANYGPSPDPMPAGFSTYAFWQYTDQSPLGYDADSFNGTTLGLDSLAAGRPVTFPPPPPAPLPPPPVTATPTVTPPPPSNQLTTGAVLASGQMLQSLNGSYQLVMQTDGNLVLYAVGRGALWASHTEGHPGAHAVMRANGNLAVWGTAGHLIFNTRTAGHGASFARVSNRGVFFVATDAGRRTWKA